MQQRHLRLVLASAFCLGIFGFAGIRHWPSGLEDYAEWLLLLTPVVAGSLLWVPRLEPQVLSRAVLWAFFFWAVLGSVLTDATTPERVLLSAGLCSASALAVLPREGLSHPPWNRAFAPVAFRGVLVLILVLALADAVVLGLTLVLYLDAHRMPDTSMITFLGVASALMFAAVGGLFRMKGWALALNLLLNVGVATLAWCIDAMPAEVAAGLTTTAVLQLAVSAPLARRIAKPGAADPSEWLGKIAPWAIGAMVAVLVAGRVARHF